MSEHDTTTPDHIKKSLALSDAELLLGGAEYQDGVLKITGEQHEALANDDATFVTKELASLATGLTLHRPEYAELDTLSGESAVENESNLRNAINEIVTPYEDMLRSEFPKKIKLFDKDARATNSTSRIVGNKDVSYNMSYVAVKGEARTAEPRTALIDVNLYGLQQPYYGYGGGGMADRDNIQIDYQDGRISQVKIVTEPLTSRVYHRSDVRGIENVKKDLIGPAHDGLAPDLINLVDDEAMPHQFAFLGEQVDRAYQVDLSLHPGKYGVSITREIGTYPKNPKTLGEDRLHRAGTETMAYRFVPNENRFIRIETSDEWMAGPKELSVEAFALLVKTALANIPTI